MGCRRMGGSPSHGTGYRWSVLKGINPKYDLPTLQSAMVVWEQKSGMKR